MVSICQKSINSGIRCRLFLYFSHLGRVFIGINGLEDRYNVIIKSDSDLAFALKNISIEHATIRFKKIMEKKVKR